MKRKRALAAALLLALLPALLAAGCTRALAPEAPPPEQTARVPAEPQAPEPEEVPEEEPPEPAKAPEPEPEPPVESEPEPEEPPEEEPGEEDVVPPRLAGELRAENDPADYTEQPGYAPEEEQHLHPDRPNDEFVFTFAGDCTFGKNHGFSSAWDFPHVVGQDYDYPFASVRQYFEDDDFTMVNLEGALTDYNVPMEKTYRFRGPPAYAKILSGSSVEIVTLANNHSGDYGQRGLSDTRASLEAENVLYVEDGGTLLVETERGMTVGVCAFFWNGWKQKDCIRELREAGAQFIISFWHWGEEGTHRVNGNQIWAAHEAIDAGADLVIGSHPHVLQHVEQYGDGVIVYSLGNFSFGGNTNPSDKDTVVFRQHVRLNEDGTTSLGETELIPCRLSSVTDRNDYQPTPYEEGSTEYERVMKLMMGT